MADKGFNINKREVAKMMGELQKEFDKNPIQVSVEADTGRVTTSHTTVNNGPVITIQGNHAQLTMGDGNIVQSGEGNTISTGYHDLANLLASITNDLPALFGGELSETEVDDLSSHSGAILQEITVAQPDPTKIRRAVNALIGFMTAASLKAADASVSEQLQLWITSLLQAVT